MKRLVSAVVAGAPLPDHAVAGAYDADWFRHLWKASECVPVCEHGALLGQPSLSENGSQPRYVTSARRGGDADFHIEPCELTTEGFLGCFHTHVYEYGTVGIAFSPGDIRAVLAHEIKLCFVQSGDHMFLLARTALTVRNFRPDDLRDDDFYGTVLHYQKQRRSFQAALLYANRHYACRFGLALYVGHQDAPLQRITPSGEGANHRGN